MRPSVILSTLLSPESRSMTFFVVVSSVIAYSYCTGGDIASIINRFIPYPFFSIPFLILFFSRRLSLGSWYTPASPLARSSDTIIVITGASGGIGYESAVELARQGATVYALMRGGKERGESIIKKIRMAAGLSTSNDRVRYMELDLNNFASINHFIIEFNKIENHIDCLINNAGIMSCPYALTNDGLESQMGINHFAHHYLTRSLLPLLKKSKVGGRVINISSMAHILAGKFSIDRYEKYAKNGGKNYDPFEAYAFSKLANVFHAKEFERRYAAEGLHAYSVHPGAVYTDIARHAPSFFQKIVSLLGAIFLKPAVWGAQTTLFVASEKADELSGGSYYVDCEKAPNHEIADDQLLAKQWYDYSDKIVDEIVARIK